MKYLFTLLAIFTLILPVSLWAQPESFLGAPVIPGAKILLKTDNRLELELNKSHDEVLKYYRKALKDYQDIRYREWKDATYIEDDGRMPWHSITISKPKGDETVSVVIVKDNWTWIVGTLVLRFVGVFVVLLILFLAMTISGAVINRAVKRMESRKKAK